MRIPSASARIHSGMMWPPQRAKMRSTPRASRKRAATAAAELAEGTGGFMGRLLWMCRAGVLLPARRDGAPFVDAAARILRSRNRTRHPLRRAAHVRERERGRGALVAAGDPLEDDGVLVPDAPRLGPPLQHLAHRPPQM